MRDQRLEKLARVLVDYSIEAGEEDQVLLSGGAAAEPLIKALYTRLLQTGATPVPLVVLPGMQELFFEHAGDQHYEKTPPVTHAIYEQADAFISIMAPTNTRALANVDPVETTSSGQTGPASPGDSYEKGALGPDALPDRGAGPGIGHGARGVRRFRFFGDGAGQRRPGAVLAGEVRRAGEAQRAAGAGEGDPALRPRDRPDALRGRQNFYKLRRERGTCPAAKSLPGR